MVVGFTYALLIITTEVVSLILMCAVLETILLIKKMLSVTDDRLVVFFTCSGSHQQ
jgi:hypothetical protein